MRNSANGRASSEPSQKSRRYSFSEAITASRSDFELLGYARDGVAVLHVHELAEEEVLDARVELLQRRVVDAERAGEFGDRLLLRRRHRAVGPREQDGRLDEHLPLGVRMQRR